MSTLPFTSALSASSGDCNVGHQRYRYRCCNCPGPVQPQCGADTTARWSAPLQPNHMAAKKHGQPLCSRSCCPSSLDSAPQGWERIHITLFQRHFYGHAHQRISFLTFPRPSMPECRASSGPAVLSHPYVCACVRVSVCVLVLGWPGLANAFVIFHGCLVEDKRFFFLGFLCFG